jgi:hypothetical protein
MILAGKWQEENKILILKIIFYITDSYISSPKQNE